jgi:hypothetical protein
MRNPVRLSTAGYNVRDNANRLKSIIARNAGDKLELDNVAPDPESQDKGDESIGYRG